MTSALYAGSFDPIHLGHVTIIERASTAFDEVVVAVLGNPGKRVGLLTVEERLRLVAAATAHLGSVRAIAHQGMTVDAARAVGATVLVRSVHKDRADEQTMAATNERIAGIVTTFVAADPATAWISSGLVRRSVAAGRLSDVRAMVPACVWDHLIATTSP